MKIVISALFLVLTALFPTLAHAIVDPLSTPNNRFGIHIISPTPQELKEAAQLVNSQGGEWGYITIVLERKERKNLPKWQEFFNELRRTKLIPIVRVATEPDGSIWKKPIEDEALEWANFLDKLNWPIKNRYVMVYNEPNHAREWGGQVDAKTYAQVLNQTIEALKGKSDDFFILNAGLDQSAPPKLPDYQDQTGFMEEMEKSVPGIFDKLDGWASHSYPNPNFTSPPNGNGKGSIRGWMWELELLKKLGVKKNLPVFITETGWKHSEGVNFNPFLLTPAKVGEYYMEAFQKIWNNPQIVAITPFLLNYQQPPFDHFSFKKITSAVSQEQVLGITTEPFHKFYYQIAALPKIKAQPIQENSAGLIEGQIYPTLALDQDYLIPLTFKNIGQSIWGSSGKIRLIAKTSDPGLVIEEVTLPDGVLIEPGQSYTLTLSVKTPKSPEGKQYKTILNLYQGDKQFDNPSFEFETEIKPAAVLQIKAILSWKENHAGEYTLTTVSANIRNVRRLWLDKTGISEPVEDRLLIPDYEYDFILQRPFYKPKTIHTQVKSGLNILDFGKLQPDFLSALFKFRELWKLLPFSN